MARTRTLRTLVSVVAAGVVALGAIGPNSAGAPPDSRPTGADDTAPAGSVTHGERPTPPRPPEEPRPPLIPADFRATGRYVVRDLGVDVPFTWQGRGGDSQMTAGGPDHPIWFTNLIYRNTLYTLTYKWPNIPLEPPRSCDRVGFLNRQMLNDFLKTSRYVGPEILQGDRDRQVDHWRVGVVGGSTVPGEQFRFPIALGDVYVDRSDPSRWWQGLQFGFQNLFDPALDEWFTLSTFTHQPGLVTLPDRCPPPL
ncbi:hypothetical protein ACFOOK_15310 [Micromonospora krabiensis]|uniref:Uncharacterized protein n=1 Tax=Micromonospora krabiensis TaxID=307121 RepID=A0A1C3N0S3_9ACTN|nr:hypothetical protein [Micromonospora krabiensis]SBV26192.1 hypothetical protein GA0070620_1677 [Micromonospora krabiensis]